MAVRSLLGLVGLFLILALLLWAPWRPASEDPRAEDTRQSEQAVAEHQVEETAPDSLGSEDHPELDAGEKREALAAPPETEVEAEPLPERALQVQVVDPEGNPEIDIPVVFQVSHPQFAGGRFPLLEVKTEGPKGIAILDLDQARGVKEPEPPARLEYSLALALPSGKGPSLVLEPPIDFGALYQLVLDPELKKWAGPLKVQVVDASGNPAPGVPLELRAERRNEPGQGNDMARAKTEGPEAIAELEIKGVRIMQSLPLAMGIEMDLLVRSELPFSEPLTLILDPDNFMEKVQVMELPPHGGLRVAVVDSKGKPLTKDQGASVYLRYRPLGSPETVGFQRFRDDWRPVENGVAYFPYIGLNVELNMWAGIHGIGTQSESISFPGPVRAGEVLEKTYFLGEPWPYVTARLFDVSGEALADQEFWMAIRHDSIQPRNPASGPYRPSYRKYKTDGEGRFQTQVAGHVRDGYRRSMECLIYEKGRRDVLRSFVRHDLNVELRADSDNDLGDLHLQAVPLLAAGQVVNEQGRPVSNARVALWIPWDRGTYQSWRRAEIGPFSTDQDGRFAIYRVEFPSTFRLEAWSHRNTATLDDLQPGLDNHLLVLKKTVPREKDPNLGHLKGHFLIDKGIAMDHLELRIRIPNVTSRGLSLMEIGPRYHVRGIQPGIASVGLRTHGTRFNLFQIEGVEILAGQSCEDPRLQGVDLRGKLRYLRLQLTDGAGRYAAKEHVWIYDAEGKGGGSERTSQDGRVAFLVPTDSAEFSINIRGSKPATVRWQEGFQTVIMEPKTED
ncbi:MAG: hypothetical protein DWQ01_01495 [Planctomycetota bacterium]|nr:MAG: hypothetical protein DWQ01_01495 [Planctomycetota bacterium]